MFCESFPFLELVLCVYWGVIPLFLKGLGKEKKMRIQFDLP